MSLKFVDGAVVEWLPGNSDSDKIYFVDGAVVESAWFEAPAAASLTATGDVEISLSSEGSGYILHTATGDVEISLSNEGSAEQPMDATGDVEISVTSEGSALASPTDLYSHSTDAQSGDTNPSNLSDTTPVFSAYCTKLSANITSVWIEVSAADDSDFSESASWDSGWLTLSTALTAAGRCENIDYGQT